MVLDLGVLGFTSSKESLLVLLNKTSGLADAYLGVHVQFYENWEVPHLARRNFQGSSIKQSIYHCTF
jgi:hypothetical protein